MATAYANITEEAWLQSSIRMGKAKGFHAARVMLTPALAKALLNLNPANRPINPRRSSRYAEDIKAGRWQFNGESLIISNDGLVIDGQHRCEAVILADEAIDTVLTFGPSYESRKTTDLGVAKNTGSFLGMDGVSNAATVSGIARMVLTYETTGAVQAMGRLSATAGLERAYSDMEGMCHAAQYAHSHAKRLRQYIAPSPFGFCYYICRARNVLAAETYFHQIATGENLKHGDPALAVRNRLLLMGKGAPQDKVEIILHGWNAFVKGEARTFVKANGQLPPLA